MKKLQAISIYLWIGIGAFFSLSIFSLSFVLNYRIEKSEQALIKVTNSFNNLIIDSPLAYRLQKKTLLIIKITEKYHNFTVEDIYYNKEQSYFQAQIISDTAELIPNTTLPVSIIFGHYRVIDLLFRHVV